MTEKTPEPENDQNRPEPEPRTSRRKIGPSFAEPEGAMQDLSSEIVKTIGKSADQRVTCRRIKGDQYRCNWWAPQQPRSGAPHERVMSGLAITTHRVARSELLHVTKTANGLAITPVSADRR